MNGVFKGKMFKIKSKVSTYFAQIDIVIKK